MSSPEIAQTQDNSSLLIENETAGGLTPRQIAGITIATVFIFYLTLMLIVCLGEYIQYVGGKKYKPDLRRPRPVAVPSVLQDSSRSQTYTEPSSSKSEEGSSSASHGASAQRFDERTGGSARRSRQALALGTSRATRASIEGNLSKLGPDCLEPCDSSGTNGGKEEIVTVPLIMENSDEQGYDKDDIYCESSESNECYKLEANV